MQKAFAAALVGLILAGCSADTTSLDLSQNAGPVKHAMHGQAFYQPM